MKCCPECITPLVQKHYKIFHVWECPEGCGTLYPKGELEKIVKALSGIGDLEMNIWNDHDRYTILESKLLSPESNLPMFEIRDRDVPIITVYGDAVNHCLWFHVGEEEKLIEHIERSAFTDSVSAYLLLAGKEAVKIFDDEEPVTRTAGHTLISLKLLGERILRALPQITI